MQQLRKNYNNSSMCMFGHFIVFVFFFLICKKVSAKFVSQNPLGSVFKHIKMGLSSVFIECKTKKQMDNHSEPHTRETC